MKEWASGDRSARYVVMPATDAISSMGAVFAFALMLRSVHLSHVTWMHFCVPRSPLIWEYYLFLERLIMLGEWSSIPISAWLHLFWLSCFDPFGALIPHFCHL